MTSLSVTPGLTLSPLTPDDADAVAQWVSMLQQAAGHRVGATPVCATDALGSLRFAPPDTLLDDWVLRLDDKVVGSLRLALVEGSEMLRVDELFVRPSHRRRGLGGVLHRHALERAARRGLSTVAGSVAEPLAGERARTDSPHEFAVAAGAHRAPGPAGLRQLLRVRPLDLRDPAQVESTVSATPDGYRLVTWGTVTPDEWVWQVSALERTLGESSATVQDANDDLDEAQGDSGRSDELDQPVSYARRFERMRVGRGRRAYHTGVVHGPDVHGPDAQLVGYTSISMTTANPHHALQGMTVVHAGHRGHGLGLILKGANLDRVRRLEPALRQVETTTDETNAPMIALNLALGYEPDERRVTWQQALSDKVE